MRWLNVDNNCENRNGRTFDQMAEDTENYQILTVEQIKALQAFNKQEYRKAGVTTPKPLSSQYEMNDKTRGLIHQITKGWTLEKLEKASPPDWMFQPVASDLKNVTMPKNYSAWTIDGVATKNTTDHFRQLKRKVSTE